MCDVMVETEKALNIWRANNEAWAIAQIFRDWFTNWFIPQVETYLKFKNLHFKALLPSPSIKLQYSNIEVMFLPPNTILLLQSLDQWLIGALKANYV